MSGRLPDGFSYIVPLTQPMLRTLDQMARGRSTARVVGARYGLPLLRYPSGEHVVLTTMGRLERLGRCDQQPSH